LQARHFAESNLAKLDDVAMLYVVHSQLELFKLLEMREHGHLTKGYFCLEFKPLELWQCLHQVKKDQVLQVPRTEHGLLGGCALDT
jgi:hypothetical protein